MPYGGISIALTEYVDYVEPEALISVTEEGKAHIPDRLRAAVGMNKLAFFMNKSIAVLYNPDMHASELINALAELPDIAAERIILKKTQ